MPLSINQIVEVLTDTATIAFFDPENLKHRINDAEDWYARQRDQQREMAKGWLVLVPTEMDGRYRIRITTDSLTSAERALVTGTDQSHCLNIQSGDLHCTAGENLPGGGQAAKTTADQILKVPSGWYHLILHGLEGSNVPGPLPYLVVQLEPVPKGARLVPSKSVPELWPRRRAERLRTRPRGKSPRVAPGHRLPEDGDAEWVSELDTGMITLFDPNELAHRVNDAEDWMLDESVLLREARLGHLAFVYSISKAFRPARVRLTMRPFPVSETDSVHALDSTGWLKVSSARLFCVSSQLLPAAGKTPPETLPGFFRLASGAYRVTFYAMKSDAKTGLPRFIIRLDPLRDKSPPPGPTKMADIYT